MIMKVAKRPIQSYQPTDDLWLFRLLVRAIRRAWVTGFCFIGLTNDRRDLRPISLNGWRTRQRYEVESHYLFRAPVRRTARIVRKKVGRNRVHWCCEWMSYLKE